MAVSDWSTTAADNATADPTINWQEGQPASTVNNSARAMMAAIAAWRGDLMPEACRLVYVSSTSVRLDRFNGTQIFVDGKPRTIPSGGVTLANTGLTAATLYYIYAYMSAATPAVLTLEASATARSTDATYGHQIKSGDATRSFVGWAYMGAGTPGTFVYTTARKLVRSWFNEPSVTAFSASTADAAAGTTVSSYGNNAIAEFIVASGETAHVRSRANALQGGGAAILIVCYAGFDAVPTQSNAITVSPGAITDVPSELSSNGLAEGYHYCTPVVSSNTGGWTLRAGSTVSVFLSR